MKSGGDRAQVAFNIENDRLTAVAASVKSNRIVVRAWVSAQRPAETDPNDPASLGKWVGEELKKAGLHRVARRGGVVFAVPRGEVVLKRITFPPLGAEADLPAMVKLQMVRQLTVSSENAAIDFVPVTAAALAAMAKKGGGAGTGGAAVLAGALQGDRLGWRKAVAKGAGVKLARVGLRSAGAAALLAEAAQRRGGATLGIALGSGSTEFVIVEDGHLVFARATDLFRPDRPEDAEGFAQRVAVEAKRTWMNYRVSPESTEIEAVVVLGTDELAKLVAERCREGLGLVSEAADYPAFVEAPAAMTPAQRSEMAPLVGLLAEPAMGRATLDFANPRKAPDRSAARRQRVLAAAALVIVGGGGVMTMGRMELMRLERELASLKSEWAQIDAEYGGLIRTQARVEHAERWVGTRMDWMEHLGVLSEKLPEPRAGVLERISGSSAAGVRFTLPRGKRNFASGTWGQGVQAVVDMSGTVKKRETADALRASLVADQDYRVESRGADTPGRFDLRVTTTLARPSRAMSPRPDEGMGASDGGAP